MQGTTLNKEFAKQFNKKLVEQFNEEFVKP